MRLSLLPMSILAAAAVLSTPAKAQNYPWCAQYTGSMGGSMNCGFTTYEQCMATVSGVGGFCVQNNTYQPSGRHRRPY
jgi:Protein of unknown function (DUF3551)